MEFHVVKSELPQAARELKSELARFEEAFRASRQSADALCGMWEGDAKDAFQAEQANNNRLFEQLIHSVEDYIKALETAGREYQNTDRECAQLLRIG